jgi:hypothetical protein
MGGVRVDLFKREEIQAYVESTRLKMKPTYDEYLAEAKRAEDQKDYGAIREITEKKYVFNLDFFTKMWDLKPLKFTRTDADGKFKIDLPDKDVDYALCASAYIKQPGAKFPVIFQWILLKEDIENPLLLSNFNQFILWGYDHPLPIGLKNNAVDPKSRAEKTPTK